MSQRTVSVTVTARDAFSPTLQKYGQQMRAAEQETSNMGREMDNLGRVANNVLGGIIGAFGIQQVIQLAGDMNELGAEVNQTSRRFNVLADEIGGPVEVMDALRRATGGAINDLDLMTEATSLMQLSIAGTSEDLARIIELAIKLKRPTEENSEAIAKFARLLSSGSAALYDNYGLNMARVNAETQRLLQSTEGLTLAEAKQQAILNESERNLARFGSAADSASTSLSRLGAVVDNVEQRLSSGFNTALESGGGLIELALGIHPAQLARQDRKLEEAGLMAAEAIQRGFSGGLYDEEFLTQFFYEAANLELRQKGRDYGPQLARQASVSLYGTDQLSYATQHDAEYSALFQQETLLKQIVAERMQAKRLQEEAARAAEQEAQYQLDMEEATRKRFENAQQEAEAHRAISDYFTLEANLASVSPYGFTDLGSVELPPFMTHEAADNLSASADEAQRIFEEMQRLDELNPDLFSDTQIDQAKSVTEEIGNLAKEADKAAAALDKLKIADVFGTGSQGPIQSLTGDLTNTVLGAMRDQGATPEQLAASERALNLASGNETIGSLAIRETFGPEIARIGTELGPDIQAAVVTQLATILTESTLQGIDPNNPDFLAGIQDLLTNNRKATSFEASLGVQPGLEILNTDPSLFVGQFSDIGTSTDTISTNSTTFLNNMEGMREPTAAVEVSFGNIQGYVSETEKAITKLTEKTQRIKLNIEVVMSGDTSGGEWLKKTLSENGVPPSDIGLR